MEGRVRDQFNLKNEISNKLYLHNCIIPLKYLEANVLTFFERLIVFNYL